MRFTRSPCPVPLASPRASVALIRLRLPEAVFPRAIPLGLWLPLRLRVSAGACLGAHGGQWEERKEKGGGAGGERVEGGDWSPGRRREPEGGRRQRAQGAAGGSQLSARPAAAASVCRGAAGWDGLVRGRPLLLPRSAAPPALRAPPTGEWPRHAGREHGRASALCVTARGPSQRRAPGGAEPLGSRSIGRGGSPRLGPRPRGPPFPVTVN